MAGEAAADDATFHIVLFYQYATVPPAPEGAAAPADGSAPADPQNVNALQAWLQQRCGELGMLGRVVLATEGINGNLASESLDNVRKFCDELQALQVFKDKPIDFKMDTSSAKPFPDLYIQIKPEICSTGHTMPKELLDKGLGGNHLKPEEFHAVLKEYWEKAKAADGAEESDNQEAKKDLIVIDVRNNVEFNTGRFMAPTGEKEAVNPCTKTFSHWATDYADKAVEELKTKKVLMYCTGGIRCEKASAYLRSKGVEDVSQLSGGIHRYLEKFGADGYFKGSNFVFDSRKLQKPEGAAVVGKCSECEAPTEEVSCDRVCAVCREPVLACDACRVKTFGVYYCALHSDLKGLYEPFLERFEIDELEKQRDGLNELVSTKFKAKGRRRPISKQLRRINEWLERKTAAKEAAEAGTRAMPKRSRFASNPRCRSCGMIGPMDLLALMGRTPSDDDLCCDGSCTGFAKANYEDPKRSLDEMNDPEFGAALCTKKRKRVQKNYRAFAKRMREETRQEYEVTSYEIVPAESSDQGVALRIVKPYFFDFNSYVKKTWEGHPILEMYTKFFTGNKVEYYRRALETGLITVDGAKVGPEKILKNGELLSNLTHRHEPPAAYVPGADMIITDSNGVVAIDKPASVTIHPSGAFRRNSLQFILAVECGLTDIHPIHRLDRHTSGIVLFAKNPEIAKKLTDAMMRKGEVGATSKISKAYLARVHGRFPATAAELEANCGRLGLNFVQRSQSTAEVRASPATQAALPGDGAGRLSKGDDSAEYLAAVALRANGLHWVEDKSDPMLELSGCTLDPAKAAQPKGGHIVVSWPLEPACMNTGTWRCCSSEKAAGKSSKAKEAMSRLRLLAYDPETDTSLVQCEPITGRTHQLRVHLAFAGHPILHDPLYGRGGDVFAGLTQRESEQNEQKRNSKLVEAALPSAEELEGLTREQVACRLCAVCTEGEEVAFKPVQLRVQGVDLHAFRYKVDLADGSTFDFSTKMPPFAAGFSPAAKH